MCLSGYFLIFLSLLLTASLLGQSANEECSLFVGVMFPPTAPNKSLSKGFTGVRRAIEIINNSSLLSGYKLYSMHLDTGCNRTQALKQLFQLGTGEQKSVAVIDAGCSTATEATAEISHLFGYSQISCQSSSPVLTNRDRFPRYFQLLPSISEMAHLFAEIVIEFHWTHVVVFVQDTVVYKTVANEVTTLFNQLNITHTSYIIATKVGISSLDPPPFENSDERIFIIATDENVAVDLLCTAYRKWTQPVLRVFITQFYSRTWYDNYNDSNCQLKTVLHLSFSVAYFKPVTEDKYDPYCYDATLFLATALNQLLNKRVWESNCSQTEGGAVLGLDNVFRTLQNLSDQTITFGETGEVTFNEFGVRTIKTTPVFQFRYTQPEGVQEKSLELVNFGLFNKSEITNYILVYNDNESNVTVFPDGIPYDGKVVTIVTTLFLPVTVGFGILASAGIIFAFSCLIFNFKFRNHKVVRLTSPTLNYFIITGAALFYIDVYFFTLPTYKEEDVRLTCNAETWFTVVAYTLCFGTIMAKMFRVWLIFRNPKPKMRLVISDWWLIAAVMALLGVDLIILTVFTIIEQAGIGGELIRLTKSLEHTQDEDGVVRVQYLRYYCDSKPHDIVSGFFYAFKGLLQVVALVLAFMTRKVKVKGLDDAKYIAAIIYITSIIIGVLTVIEYSLDDYINAYASIFATGLSLIPTCVLLLVFVPTMIRLYKDPKGENVFAAPHTISTVGDDQAILTLRTRVRELENLLLSTVAEDKNNPQNKLTQLEH